MSHAESQATERLEEPAPASPAEATGNRLLLGIGIAMALLAVLFAYLALPSVPRSEDLQVDGAVRKMETVRQGAKLEARFTLTNAGSKTLEPLELTKSCSCTSAQLAKTSLAPGESTVLDVAVNVGQMRNMLSSQIQVSYPDLSPESPTDTGKLGEVAKKQLLLQVLAPISADIEYEPQVVTFDWSARAPKKVRLFSKWISGKLIVRANPRHKAFGVKLLGDNSLEISFDPTLWPKDETQATQVVVQTTSRYQPTLGVPVRVISPK